MGGLAKAMRSSLIFGSTIIVISVFNWLVYSTWSELSVECKKAKKILDGLACHKAISCGHKREYGEMEDSVIIFGGYDFSNEPQNILYQIKMKQNKAIVLRVRTKGLPPAPRYLHSMVLMENGRSINLTFLKKKQFSYLVELGKEAKFSMISMHS